MGRGTREAWTGWGLGQARLSQHLRRRRARRDAPDLRRARGSQWGGGGGGGMAGRAAVLLATTGHTRTSSGTFDGPGPRAWLSDPARGPV